VGVSRPITSDRALFTPFWGREHVKAAPFFNESICFVVMKHPFRNGGYHCDQPWGCVEQINQRTRAALASFTYDSTSNRLKRKTCGFAPWARGREYQEGRQPGGLGTTAAGKPQQLQKQKLPSRPQPPTQKKWEGHHSGRWPAPCRLGHRARAGGLMVLGRSRAPLPTSPVHWIAQC